MSRPLLSKTFRAGLLGMSAAAVVLAAPADEPRSPTPDAGTAPAQRPAAARQKKAVPTEDHVELERLKRSMPAKEGTKDGAKDTAGAEAKPEAEAAAKTDVPNAFASTSWYVPPPPPKPEPPPKPTAPPIPFAFMGRYDDAGKAPTVMLVRGDRLYTVAAGDVIDDTYRVDRITDRVVELIYLPLKTKQVLQTGGT